VFDPPFAVSIDYTDYGSICAVRETSPDSGRPCASKAPFWKDTARNALDQITEEVFGNGVVTSRTFDMRGRPLSIMTNGNGDPIQDLAYQYYPNSNLWSQTDKIEGVNETYSFDALNRLRRAGTQALHYDDIGNLRSRSLPSGKTLVYRYNRLHAGPHAATSVNGATYRYDRAGREIRAPFRSTTYFSFGLPKHIAGNRAADLKYDFQQQRTVKILSNGIHEVSVGGLFERVSTGNGLARNTYYVRAGGRAVAAVVWDELSRTRSVRYLHDDRLGSVAATSDLGGALLESRAYDPFGTLRRSRHASVPGPSSLEPLGFTERQPDPESRLINMLGRLYDPTLGRLTTPDPLISAALSSQGYNRYGYVLNNPLRWTDPTGLQCVELCFRIAPMGSDPSEWVSLPPPLTPPPLVSGPELTPPPLLSAPISDDTGLTPPPLVSAPEEPIPQLRRPSPESDLRAFATLSLPLERLGSVIPFGSLLERAPFGGIVGVAKFYYGTSKYFLKDLWVNIGKFVANKPDMIAMGTNGPIFESDEQLGYEAQKSIFTIAMAALPFAGPEVVAEEGGVVANAGNYRELFIESTGENLPEGWAVHHSIPQRYETLMSSEGINVHELQFLRGIEPAEHEVITGIWQQWHGAAGGNPTAAQVADFAKFIDELFGEHFFWPGF
jgi:RHS repeat-associated protein